MKESSSLKPCPFCGGKAKISVGDDEGNQRNEEYEKNPWSGLSYRLHHGHESNTDCPIANFEEDGAMIGVYLYDSREEAVKAWNTRFN